MTPKYFKTALLSATLAIASCADDAPVREVPLLAAYALPEDDEWPEDDAWAEEVPEPDVEEPNWSEDPAWSEPEVEPQPEAEEPDWAEEPTWREPEVEPQPEAEEPTWSQPEAEAPPPTEPVAEPTQPEEPIIDPVIDTDGDSLPDWIEVNGYEQGGRILDLPALGADPTRKDIFVEIDYMPGFRPSPAAIAMVEAAFANSPVDDGKGIALHVLVDQELTAADAKPEIDLNDVERLRNRYFDPLRDVAFHWALFAKKRTGTNSSGVGAISGTWLVVSLGADIWKGYTDTMVAGTFMHELGHNLGLFHGGTQDISAFTPNYMSVMSYHYQLGGVPRDGGKHLDYSRISIAALDEALLSETAALTPGDSATTETQLARYKNPQICLEQTGSPGTEVCNSYATLEGNLSQNLDFNRMNGIESGTVMANLDGFAGNTKIPALEDDWSHLVYHGGRVLGADSPPPRRHVATEHVVECLSQP